MKFFKILILSLLFGAIFFSCSKEADLIDSKAVELSSDPIIGYTETPSDNPFYSNDYSFNEEICLTGNDLAPRAFDLMNLFSGKNAHQLEVYSKIFGRPVWSLFLEGANDTETFTILPFVGKEKNVESILVWQWTIEGTSELIFYRQEDIDYLLEHGSDFYPEDNIEALESIKNMILFCEDALFCNDNAIDLSNSVKVRTDVNYVQVLPDCPNCVKDVSQLIDFRTVNPCEDDKPDSGGGGGGDNGGSNPPVINPSSFGGWSSGYSATWLPGGKNNGGGGGSANSPGLNDHLEPTEIDQFLGGLFRFARTYDLPFSEDELFDIIPSSCMNEFGIIDYDCAMNAVVSPNSQITLEDWICLNNFIQNNELGMSVADLGAITGNPPSCSDQDVFDEFTMEKLFLNEILNNMNDNPDLIQIVSEVEEPVTGTTPLCAAMFDFNYIGSSDVDQGSGISNLEVQIPIFGQNMNLSLSNLYLQVQNFDNANCPLTISQIAANAINLAISSTTNSFNIGDVVTAMDEEGNPTSDFNFQIKATFLREVFRNFNTLIGPCTPAESNLNSEVKMFGDHSGGLLSLLGQNVIFTDHQEEFANNCN